MTTSVSEFIETEQVLILFEFILWHNRYWGRFRIAEEYGRRSVALSKQYFEPGHLDIATILSNQAEALMDLGELRELREAKKLLREALESNENTFEHGHPTIARDQSNLASVLRNLEEF